MELLQQLFDPYELKGRIFPAILTLLPLGVSAILWYPNLLDSFNTALTLLGIIIILVVLSKISRNMGIKKQQIMLQEWGGFPTTIMLRHTDQTVDPLTKGRYHAFLRNNIPNIEIPTPEEESEKPEYYDMHYNSAVKWLREYTRDKTIYSILHADNANYGFARNTFGMKGVGIILCLLTLALNILGIYQKYGNDVLTTPFKFWVSVSFSIIFIFIWTFFINKKMVRNYADAYARTLLSTCEKD
jgi:hypothetical protein